MGYIDEALDEVKRATPTSGVNVCIYDDFEDVGDKLETIGNFDNVEEAQNFIDNYEGEAELVMYEAEVDEAEEKGTSDGAKKGWQTRQRGKTKLNTRLPSYTPQKNHSISNYISMAEDDYEKGTTRDNDEYEKINYHSNSKFNAPHRTIYEEKLNNNDKYDEFIEDNFNFEDDYGLARGWDCKRCGKAFEEDESYLLVDHAKTHGITIYGMDSLEEKLNKDGTGVKRATRGLNPKKTKAKVLQFVYVSKSECEVCRQYDGMAFATDSPNRPIIPRLESQGKRGSRPYTHPNCKCKWVRPFSDAGIKNFDEIGMKDSDNINFLETSNETYESVKASLYDYAHKKYGKKFDRLPKSRKHYILMQELMRQLKSDEALDPTSLPIASMLKMTYDAIQPTLALRLSKMTHKHTNEVRDLIDDMVGESLSSERKHEIVLEHNLDFTFENLLDLTVTALEHDVWDEEKNKLVDPSLLEDKEEGDEGIDDEQYMPDVYNIDPYPHRHEFIDNVCIICDYVLKASEDHSKPYTDKFGKRHVSWTCPKCGEEFGIAGHSGEGERFEHLMSHESKATEIYTEEDEIKRLDKQNNELAGILSRMNTNKIEMLKIDIRWEQKRLEDIENNIHPDEFYELYNERVKAQLLSHSKRKLESKKQELKELTGESKASENDSQLELDLVQQYEGSTMQVKNNMAQNMGFKNWKEMIGKLKMRIKLDENGDTFEELSDAERNAWLNIFELDPNTSSLYESKANEGGRGSGRKGHQKWMLGAEADPEECPNCMIFTEKKNGNCQICGNSY